MHELSIMESVLRTVLKHAEKNQVTKIVAVNLQIGELSDFIDEWMQRYFDHLSKGTLAEGALLKVERTPIVFSCKACAHSFALSKEELDGVQCPGCGGRELNLEAGREFYIKDIEVM